MFIYERFEKLQKSKGVTKVFLADAIGRQKTVFSNWKRGSSTPSPDQLAVIADILGTTPAYLTGETDDPGAKKAPAWDGGGEVRTTMHRLVDEMSDADAAKLLALAKTLFDM